MADWAAYAKHWDIFKSNLANCLKRQVYSSCVLPAMRYGRDMDTDQASKNKLAPAQTKMERSMLNKTYKDRKTNIWAREKTKVIDKKNYNQQCEKNEMVLGRAYQPLQRQPMDLACHHDMKRRQGRPAKRWRDDLDKYWSDTIWQRTAQDRLTRIQHAEAFAQPRDTTTAQWCWWWWLMVTLIQMCSKLRYITPAMHDN